MQVFNFVFHYGGEFIRNNDNKLFYIGEVQTLVYGQHVEKLTISELKKLVNE